LSGWLWLISFCLFARLAAQLYHAEDLLDCGNFVMADDAVGPAQRAYDGKHRIEQLRIKQLRCATRRLPMIVRFRTRFVT
jgi:hypothetical protein